MSLHNGSEPRDLSQYDAMSTEALEEILRQVPISPKDGEFSEDDADRIHYISQIVAERYKGTDRYGDADASWESFKRKHLSSAEESNITPIITPRKGRARMAARTALIVAVFAVLLIGTAYAAEILGWIPDWSDDLFSFTKEEVATQAADEIDSNAEYDTLEEALAAYNAPENMVPSYIPEGYELVRFEYFIDTMNNVHFGQIYKKNGNTISLNYVLYENTIVEGGYTKDEGEPEVYEVNGIEHYIMSNVGKYHAIWQRDNFEISFSGFENREDLIKTINSIYE